MRSRSDSKSRPFSRRPRPVDLDALTDADQAEVERLNDTQIGESWSLPVAPGASTRVLAWMGPQHWLHNLRRDLATEHGVSLCRTAHTCPETVVKVAETLTKFADSESGRGVTAALATIGARCELRPKAVQRCRRVLSQLGYAREMARGRKLGYLERAAALLHHGGVQEAAASAWHLTVPRTAEALPKPPLTPRRRSASLGRLNRAAHAAAGRTAAGRTAAGRTAAGRTAAPTTSAKDRDRLSSSTSVEEESSVGKKSPKRASARKNSHRAGEGRPLHVQRAAAYVVANCHGMDKGLVRSSSGVYVRSSAGRHIGVVADMITAAGIDTSRWSGRDICRRLDQLLREEGMAWPDRLSSPVGFLRCLLLRIDWSGQSPSQLAAIRQAAREAAHRAAEHHQPVVVREARRVDTVPGEDVMAYRQWREAMDAKHPHLRRAADNADPVLVESPAAREHRAWAATPAVQAARDAKAAAEAARREASRRVHGPSVVEEIAADACQCGKPAPLRTALPIPMAVCDPCWSAQGGLELEQELAGEVAL